MAYSLAPKSRRMCMCVCLCVSVYTVPTVEYVGCLHAASCLVTTCFVLPTVPCLFVANDMAMKLLALERALEEAPRHRLDLRGILSVYSSIRLSIYLLLYHFIPPCRLNGCDP
ncbi:hypothetical protein GGR51DRAFT_123383 [Nemania sp. FL0031]|nr:hypothetical protein GGR51DRAFT_123383 [Nemania sp. FL0031]